MKHTLIFSCLSRFFYVDCIVCNYTKKHASYHLNHQHIGIKSKYIIFYIYSIFGTQMFLFQLTEYSVKP